MKVLVTGGSGFLGRNLTEHLSKEGCEIYNLGSSKVEGSKHFLLKSPVDKKVIDNTISEVRPDYVFHLAGLAIRGCTIEQAFTVNTFYCDYILSAIDKAGLGYHTKVIIVGSAAEYGTIEPFQLPISENSACNPTNFYGMSKLAQTHRALAWQTSRKGLVVIRPFNVVGLNMPRHTALGNFFDQIQAIVGEGILKTGNLDSSRDLIAVSDVSRIMWQLIRNENAYGEIVNICSGEATRMDRVVDFILKLSNKRIELKTGEGRSSSSETKIHYGDNTKLQSLIGPYSFASWEDTILDVMKNKADQYGYNV